MTVAMCLGGGFLPVHPSQALTTFQGPGLVFHIFVPWIPYLSSGHNKGAPCIGFFFFFRGGGTIKLLLSRCPQGIARELNPGATCFVNEV